MASIKILYAVHHRSFDSDAWEGIVSIWGSKVDAELEVERLGESQGDYSHYSYFHEVKPFKINSNNPEVEL